MAPAPDLLGLHSLHLPSGAHGKAYVVYAAIPDHALHRK